MSKTPVHDALPDECHISPYLRGTPEKREYPHFFQMIVGVAPDSIKVFSSTDVATLMRAFRTVTGVDPLVATQPLAEIWEYVHASGAGKAQASK